MTFHSNCQLAKGRIDPAPMVDIVFLLLIFIALSSPYVVQPGLAIDLTSARPNVNSFQGVVLTVSRDDLMFFSNQKTNLEGLRSVLERAAAQSRNQTLVIKADRRVSNDTIIQIFSIAREAGFSAVNWATRPDISGQALP